MAVKQKILIVEDEKAMAEMYETRFVQEGYQVFLAGTAEEGMVQARTKRPDLILLDILLPTENGLSLLAKIRGDPQLKDLKVVALSNYDEPKTKQEAYELGVAEYLLKTNYTPGELAQKVVRHLEK